MNSASKDVMNVALLMGGESAEREVSLSSGAAVQQALQQLGHHVQVADGIDGLKKLNKQAVDVVFNILHGADGEDGQLAAWLNLEGYVSTCVDFAAASISWHKDQAKAIIARAGIQTPESQLLKQADELKISGKGPWIIKPATEGSSVGLFKANNEAELTQAVCSAFKVANQILVEDFIDGIECTVGVVGGVVLPVVSIVPASELYDYHAKYQSNTTQYHCPANFSQQWQLALQQDAKTVCQALNINGWCRVDFIVDKQGQRWFLEVNTTPGMTNSSLLPKAAAVYGWDFNRLVAEILATADKVTVGVTHE
jgi:D-alanine-D-alanine ligase